MLVVPADEPNFVAVKIIDFGSGIPEHILGSIFDPFFTTKTKGKGTGPESLDAAATVASELGWRSVWVTDHLLVPREEEEEYGSILEALTALTYVGARHERLLLGTSVVVPAMRDAPLLAKQLATMDLLSGGRLVVGVGASDRADWIEYGNLGKQDRFADRGAYLDETIVLWRHLWSGDARPFRGRFHQLEDFCFAPLPPQGAGVPILSGGRSPRALRRVAELADGYHAAQTGPSDLEEKLPLLARACEERGRGLPRVSVRSRVHFDQPPTRRYALCESDQAMVRDLVAFAAAGAAEVDVIFDAVTPDELVTLVRRFDEAAVQPAARLIRDGAFSAGS